MRVHPGSAAPKSVGASASSATTAKHVVIALLCPAEHCTRVEKKVSEKKLFTVLPFLPPVPYNRDSSPQVVPPTFLNSRRDRASGRIHVASGWAVHGLHRQPTSLLGQDRARQAVRTSDGRPTLRSKAVFVPRSRRVEGRQLAARRRHVLAARAARVRAPARYRRPGRASLRAQARNR